jgi:tetratricopeptide (TPR) repeat protein
VLTAIADYTKAIEINPNYASTYYNRGILKKDLKDYSGAIADYTKAIEINPNYAIAYYNRGNSKENL